MAIFSRFALAIVLFTAVVWIILPLAVIAAPQAGHVEGKACPCCDGPAMIGPINACPGCQAATPADDGLQLHPATSSYAWTETAALRFTGIDSGPPEPPPR